MKLWIRLIWYFLSLAWRPKLSLPEDQSQLNFRVSLTDLDTSMHMNNGVYLTLMDLGRLDIMICSGLWRIVLKKNLTPIASAIAIRYRREMRLGHAFTLQTRIIHWNDRTVVIAQTFKLRSGPHAGHVAAEALFKGGLYDRKARAFVPIEELMTAIDVQATSPAPTPEVKAFLETDTALKHVSRHRVDHDR